jgi:hypothetical protein
MMNKSDLDLNAQESREAVHKNAILMLERLNALIAVIETPEANLDLKFLEETVEKCWELGSQVCTLGSHLVNDDDLQEQWDMMSEAIGDYLGGP